MTITGGIVSNTNDVELSISVEGGKSYKRVYNDVVSVAINKFVIISSTLSKILITKASSQDINFYIDQVKLLLQRSHVEFIPGNLPFHKKYNMWLIDGYIRMLLETSDIKLITQLLDLDSILYSIEDASLDQGAPTFIDFQIPKNIKIKTIHDINSSVEIVSPVAEELSAYLHSLNNNISLLTKFIEENKSAFNQIYKEIITIASKYLS